MSARHLQKGMLWKLMSYLRRHRLSSVCARFGIFLVILVLSVNLLLLLFAKSEHNVKSLQWSRSVAVPDNILVQEFTPEKIRALGPVHDIMPSSSDLQKLQVLNLNYSNGINARLKKSRDRVSTNASFTKHIIDGKDYLHRHTFAKIESTVTGKHRNLDQNETATNVAKEHVISKDEYKDINQSIGNYSVSLLKRTRQDLENGILKMELLQNANLAQNVSRIKIFKGMPNKTRSGHSPGAVRRYMNHTICVRFIALYTSSMKPFSYWPEYAQLNRLFEQARKIPGNNVSFPRAYIACPSHSCDINIQPTDDEQVMAGSDAVIMNMTPLKVRKKAALVSDRLTRTHAPKPKVVFYAMESAPRMNTWDRTIKDIRYHYSMTYHTSSDVVLPYGKFIHERPLDDPGSHANYSVGKTKLIAWMASNCNFTFWPRQEWVTKLNERLPVDSYGKCGSLTCLPKFSANCTRNLRSYKFYLALESTQCDDYITEKFWDNCLLNGVVPVVYGGRKEAYDRLAPPRSFIHVGDFPSVRELADYLKMLDNRNDLYEEFFAWRKIGHVQKIYPELQPSAFCNLLPTLSERTLPEVKRVKDSEYFNGCREEIGTWYSKRGDIITWSPWK